MVVRLFLHLGYPQVEYTGGPGDKGCDIFVITEDLEKMVIQCKFTHTESDAKIEGVEDIQRACEAYDSNIGLLCINNRILSQAAKELLDAMNSLGYEVDYWNYHNFERFLKGLRNIRYIGKILEIINSKL